MVVVVIFRLEFSHFNPLQLESKYKKTTQHFFEDKKK